jgi:hypothetical protein
MINQQGTLTKDSSETICIKVLYKKRKKNFINWFIGFCEGHENLFIVNRRYARFELSCTLKNGNILYYIKNKLGFGFIRKIKFLNTTILEYYVQDNIYDLLELIKIFNGEFRCSSKNQYFLIFYEKIKVRLKKNNLLDILPDYKDKLKAVTLQSSWLLGYIDSRVLFYGRWQKSKNFKNKIIYLNCIFWHLNANLLYKIKEALNLTTSKIEERFKWNLPFFRLIVDDINEKKIIKKYLLKYKLKTVKLKRYKYWSLLLHLECKYKETGEQDLINIEKYLIKLTSTIEEGELNKI